MAAAKETDTTVDPFESFREMRDAYLDGMSKVMIKAVNSEEYAQATGAMLDSCLTLSAPFREAFDKVMAMALEQSSMPSRQQVAGLAERFTNLEMKLDDLDAKLDRLIELSSSQPAAVSVSAAAKRHIAVEAKSTHQADTRKI
jgi:hypothetical protein